MAKRLKKLLKKIAPIAALGLGAAALGRNKGVAFGRPKRSFDQMAADAAMPGNLSPDMGMKRKEFMKGIQDYDYMPINYKKGGRVKGAGKAKRGSGRAFTKRKK